MNNKHIFGICLIASINICYLFIKFLKDDTLQEWRQYLPKNKMQVPKYIGSMKKIVFWNPWFSDKNWRYDMEFSLQDKVIHCESHYCVLSTKRSQPLQYDALIFHTKDAHHPPRERLSNQVYIAMVQENPYYRGGSFIKGNTFYNWTMTYKQESDIWIPYFTVLRRDVDEKYNQLIPILPQMAYNRSVSEAMVFWVVSHCYTAGKRERYVNALKKHIKVDIYGWCGMDCKQKNCHSVLAKTGRYKFYLSFENGVCKDYITEKALNPLKFGLLPVVFGGLTREDYKEIMPPNSFIDARNFKSAKHLAEFLNHLDKNDTAYMEYFTWREKYYVISGCGRTCKICEALNNRSMTTKHRNVNFGEFINRRDCDGNLWSNA